MSSANMVRPMHLEAASTFRKGLPITLNCFVLIGGSTAAAEKAAPRPAPAKAGAYMAQFLPNSRQLQLPRIFSNSPCNDRDFRLMLLQYPAASVLISRQA